MKLNTLLESYAKTQQYLKDAFDGANMTPVRRVGRGPAYDKALAEAAVFFSEVLTGKRPFWQLKEAMSTSDFPLLFGDTIDRMMVEKYKELPSTWEDYCHVTTVRDFRTVKRFRASRGSGRLDQVTEGGDYKGDAVDESSYSFAIKKYGRRRDLLWEALVNDDLDALRSAPDDLAWQAKNTEWYISTSLWAANTTLYATTHSVGGTNYANKFTAPFSADALATVIGTMGEYPDDDGESPILIDPIYIVVATRAMELKVSQVLSSLIVAYTGSADRENLPTANIISAELRNKMQVRYNPWIRVLDPTNYATSWYLFCNPADGWAAECSRLVGHEIPELFMKSSNQVLLSGSLTSPMEGDFDTDSVAYKVRHCFGGAHTNAVGGWRFSAWSDGTS